MDPNTSEVPLSEVKRVEGALRSDILTAVLPPGTALRQEALCRRYRSSRTPVRQALTTLAMSGLVSIPTSGTAAVREVSARGLIEILDMRIILEPLAAARAVATMPGDVIADMEARISSVEASGSTPETVEALDQFFHVTLAAWCGNSYLMNSITGLHQHLALARIKDLTARHDLVLSSLTTITRALVDRDARKVEAAMCAHIDDFRRSLIP